MRSPILAATGILSIATVCLIRTMDNAHADSATQPATTQAASSQPATTTAAAITWDEASKHVGETVSVTGPVAGTHVTATKAVILNVGKDYPDPSRFSIMITPGDKETLSEDTYKGKTVTVTGKITLYRKAPEIKAKSADVTIEQ